MNLPAGKKELFPIVRSLKKDLKQKESLGDVVLPKRKSHSGRKKKASSAQTFDEAAVPLDPFSVSSELNALSFEELRETVLNCQKCGLCATRTNVVFGTGNPNADLMFVGEAPGQDEDIQGIPFVGRAGQLLTKIIEAMGTTREDVFIANVLKCRPPQNRNPKPEEVAECEPYLLAQIARIQPKVIVALGTWAAQTLLKTDRKISGLRGVFHEYHGVRLMPTFHPAYLLRNPSGKKTVWEDMKAVMKVLKMPVPARKSGSS